VEGENFRWNGDKKLEVMMRVIDVLLQKLPRILDMPSFGVEERYGGTKESLEGATRYA